MAALRENLTQAGYVTAEYIGGGEYKLTDECGLQELWYVNPGHASYGIKLDNGDELEFLRSIPDNS